MAPLVILIVFLGVYPKPVLDRINPSVEQLIAHVEAVTGSPTQPPVATKGVAGANEADGGNGADTGNSANPGNSAGTGNSADTGNSAGGLNGAEGLK